MYTYSYDRFTRLADDIFAPDDDFCEGELVGLTPR
jgi:hypothetical protein